MQYKIAINKMALDGKIPDGDHRWSAFNDGFENLERETIDFANDIFTGHAYTAWHNGRRKAENFICAQHIAVDMDTEDERSTIDSIRKNEFVSVYGSLIYTTPNHTPEAPRARIVFFLDQPINDAEAYKAAIGFIYGLFPDPDMSCVDSSRFFYGSKNCQIEWLDNVLPVAHLRNYYKRWLRTNPNTESKPQTKQNTLKQTFAPKTTSEKEIVNALEKIDPWSIDFKKWVAILAAIHDEFGEAGLSLADSWAQGKPGEVERRWKTFGKYTGRKATLASIFGLTKTH